ncbi:hypothetical protein HPB49_022647 [Dermacentor silvarum]|uniref:Uncharacterized protein n=1 Tax=Dermacentor silvarum TaxID=543639 RepID=A0ACB8E3P6_DERSI|nr:hypothetical protein HPB49_022647 [Dermacentor silvarum]
MQFHAEAAGAPSAVRCQRLVAVDNSEAMLDFAREHRADPRIEVYSFLAIHWTADQRSAMRNIETLMAPGGECFLVFSDNIVLFDIFKAMMTQPRWAKYSDVSTREVEWRSYNVEDGLAEDLPAPRGGYNEADERDDCGDDFYY